MLYLKADTITEVTVGPAVAVGDGFTPVTNLVGASADEFEIIKHGATTTTTIAGTLAAITGADGYYALDLSATDTNTEGRLVLLINDDSLILPIRHEFMVVNANVFDSLFSAAATDYLQVDSIQVGGTTQTAGDIPALVTTVDGVVDTINTNVSALNDIAATDIVSGGAITTSGGAVSNVTTVATTTTNTDMVAAAPTVAAIADAVWDETLTAHVTADSAAVYVKDIDTAVDAIQVKTDFLPSATAGAAGGVFIAGTNAATSITTGLTTTFTGNLTGSVDSVTNAVGSVTGAVGSVTGSVGSVVGAVGSVTGAVGSVTAEVTADLTKLSGSATAADNLEASALGIIPGTAQTGTLSTTVMTTNLTGYLDDELIGRVIVWTGGQAAGQMSEITDYASTNGTLTYNTITTAPLNNDTFVIV